MLVLTLDEVHVLHESALRLGYWCEAVAVSPLHDRVFWLGSHPAGSPRLALRWLRGRALDLADQLDLAHARPVFGWLNDAGEMQRAMSALTAGEMYDLSVYDDHARDLLSARPTSPALTDPTRGGIPPGFAWRSAPGPGPPSGAGGSAGTTTVPAAVPILLWIVNTSVPVIGRRGRSLRSPVLVAHLGCWLYRSAGQ